MYLPPQLQGLLSHSNPLPSMGTASDSMRSTGGDLGWLQGISQLTPNQTPAQSVQIGDWSAPMTPKGLSFLTEVEGSRPKMYKDSAGYPTIGVGHLLTPQERQTGVLSIRGEMVDWRKGLSPDQITGLLEQDTEWADLAVQTHVKADLTDNQKDALTSFVFNVGEGAFKNSTLLRRLNRGEYEAVPAELQKWTKAGGKHTPGLANRRNKEINLWLT